MPPEAGSRSESGSTSEAGRAGGAGDGTHGDRARLAAEVDVLVGRISRWNQSGWAEPAGTGTRADAVHALVQRLADVAADAEHGPRRTVPRLDPAVLPDQLTVMVHDVLATGSAAALHAALGAVGHARAELFRSRRDT